MTSQRRNRVVLLLSLVVLSWRLAEAGLLEEAPENMNNVNSVGGKKDLSASTPLPCLDTDRSGVAPCDTDPKCCHTDGPKLREGAVDYCCPPGSSQFRIHVDKEFTCACAL